MVRSLAQTHFLYLLPSFTRKGEKVTGICSLPRREPQPTAIEVPGAIDSAIDELHNQVANLKSLVTSNKKSGNRNGSNQKKTYPTEPVIMDPRLIVKPPVATDHGPFKEN